MRAKRSPGQCALSSEAYRAAVDGLQVGKRLPSAVYLHKSALERADGVVLAAVEAGEAIADLKRGDWDVVKLDRLELKISLLAYPTFSNDPHPALERSVCVDLAGGEAAVRAYDPGGNPPILHRKDTMLCPRHERFDEFARLTRAEEQAGLLSRVARIGFRNDWEALIEECGVSFRGHQLLVNGQAARARDLGVVPSVHAAARAKTAIRRRDLSAPMRFLVESKVVRPEWSVFDYGCGVGADVEMLKGLGFEAAGWDPFHHAEEPKLEADVVHLGYVLNVIDDPEEREEVLRDAYGLARVALSVAVRTTTSGPEPLGDAPDADGIITSRGTFQKYFTEDEFLDLLASTLNGRPVRCLPHLYLVLRNTDHRDEIEELARDHAAVFGSAQSLAVRERRLARERELAELFDRHSEVLEAFWATAVRKGKGLSIAQSDEARALLTAGVTPREAFETYRWKHNGRSIVLARKEHQLGLVDKYWKALLRFGRPPNIEEAPDLNLEMKAVGISPNRLLRWCLDVKDERVWTRASNRRRESVMAELAALSLRRRVAFSSLPDRLQRDIRYYFGSFVRALDLGLGLLKRAAKPEEVHAAAIESGFGVLEDGALFVCTQSRDYLPLVLRLRVICAAIVTPEVLEYHVLKIDLERPEVVGYRYSEFDSSPLPQLLQRVAVNFGNPRERFFGEEASSKVKLLWARHLLVPKSSRLRRAWQSQHEQIRPALAPFLKAKPAPSEQHESPLSQVWRGPIHIAIAREVAAQLGFVSAV